MMSEVYVVLAVLTLLTLIPFIRSLKLKNGTALLLFIWSLIPVISVALLLLMLIYYAALKQNGPLDRLHKWWYTNPYGETRET